MHTKKNAFSDRKQFRRNARPRLPAILIDKRAISNRQLKRQSARIVRCQRRNRRLQSSKNFEQVILSFRNNNKIK